MSQPLGRGMGHVLRCVGKPFLLYQCRDLGSGHIVVFTVYVAHKIFPYCKHYGSSNSG